MLERHRYIVNKTSFRIFIMRQIGIKIRKVLQCTGAPKPVEDSLVNISTESDVHRTGGTVGTLNTAIDLALLSFPNLAVLIRTRYFCFDSNI